MTVQTDRELLEAAARAAGVHLEWDGPPDQWSPMFYEGKTYHAWNPLDDDGDALRLAVKLRIGLGDRDTTITAQRRGGMSSGSVYVEEFGSDLYQATRRAIVRAAAAIGDHAQNQPDVSNP